MASQGRLGARLGPAAYFVMHITLVKGVSIRRKYSHTHTHNLFLLTLFKQIKRHWIFNLFSPFLNYYFFITAVQFYFSTFSIYYLKGNIE